LNPSSPAVKFTSLPIRTELLQALAAGNYLDMTPVQGACLPQILAGKDVLAQAKTGSGKTAAFAVGLLNKLDVLSYHTQVLILCPTRELADQVAAVIRQLSSAIANTRVLTLCGGKPLQDQLASLQRNPHVVVGTPGRILKHLERKTLDVSGVQALVLDEADRMLDMGFQDEISSILSFLKTERQTLLFSATYPESIQAISADVQRDPVEVRIDTNTEESIRQVFYEVTRANKVQSLIKLLGHHQPESCIVFCNQKNDCRQLVEALETAGFYALGLHGDLDQYQRDQALVQFSNQSCTLLIATDVAARGLDIKELSAVVNYDLTPNPEMHVHRVGRTGRAGKHGIALTLYQANEANGVLAIEDYQGQVFEKKNIDDVPAGNSGPKAPAMITLQIRGGRKDKVRPGDVLGALTANNSIAGDQIGKITIADKTSYVAVHRGSGKLALRTISEGKIKGRKFRANLLH